MPNKIIILYEGPIAAGKTTSILKTQSNHPEFSVVDFDLLKERTFKLGDWNIWNKQMIKHGKDWRRKVAYSVGLFWMQKLCILEMPILAELCYTYDEINKIYEIAHEYDYLIIRVLLYPNLQFCLDANQERDLEKKHVAYLEEKVKETYDYYKKLKNEVKYNYIIDTSADSVFNHIDFKELLDANVHS